MTNTMRTFALQDLHRFYSTFNGWTVQQETWQDNSVLTVLLERMHEGSQETAKVLVSYNAAITADEIKDLKVSGAPRFGRLPRHECAIIAPKNADVTLVPAGVRIYSMNSFAIDNGALVWEKRPVRKGADVCVAEARKATA